MISGNDVGFCDGAVAQMCDTHVGHVASALLRDVLKFTSADRTLVHASRVLFLDLLDCIKIYMSWG